MVLLNPWRQQYNINSVRTSNHSPSLPINQQLRRQHIIPRFLIQTGETFANYQYFAVILIIQLITTATVFSCPICPTIKQEDWLQAHYQIFFLFERNIQNCESNCSQIPNSNHSNRSSDWNNNAFCGPSNIRFSKNLKFVQSWYSERHARSRIINQFMCSASYCITWQRVSFRIIHWGSRKWKLYHVAN